MTILDRFGRPLLPVARPRAADATSLLSSGWVSQPITSTERSEWTDRDAWGDGAWLRSYEQVYRSQPVVAAVIDKLTKRIASLPLGAHREAENGSREPLPRSHGLQTLLRRPIPGWSGTHLVAHIVQSLLVHGNALVAKVRTLGPDTPVDMLWPLDWAQMAGYARQGGRIEFWSTLQLDGVERWVSPADVVHFAWPAPSGGQIGVSPLEKLQTTIAVDDAAQRHQTALLRNGIRPSLMIALKDGGVKLDKIEAVRARVEAMHKGPDRAGGTMFFGAPVDVQPLSLTPVEMQLIDQRHASWEEVGMVFDLGGPLMNDFRFGTYSNVEETNRALYRDIVPPWATLIVETLEAQLVDVEAAWSGTLIRFDFTDKLRGEPLEQANRLSTLVAGHIISTDEARRELGLAPRGGMADELLGNVNNVGPITRLDEVGPQETPDTPAVGVSEMAAAMNAAVEAGAAPAGGGATRRGEPSE